MKKTQAQPVTAREQLLEDLNRTKNALDTAYSNFENVIDPDLIDCYTYEIYAVQKRYKFLLETHIFSIQQRCNAVTANSQANVSVTAAI